MIKYCALILLALTFAGCQCFPPGPPPDDNIVDSYDPTPRSLATAINELSNNLLAYGITRLNGKTVQPVILGGDRVKENTEKALKGPRSIIGFGLAALEPDYILNSGWTETAPGLFRWEMTLTERDAPDKILWQQAVIVDINL
jgi:hypothetical protein